MVKIIVLMPMERTHFYQLTSRFADKMTVKWAGSMKTAGQFLSGARDVWVVLYDRTKKVLRQIKDILCMYDSVAVTVVGFRETPDTRRYFDHLPLIGVKSLEYPLVWLSESQPRSLWGRLHGFWIDIRIWLSTKWLVCSAFRKEVIHKTSGRE